MTKGYTIIAIRGGELAVLKTAKYNYKAVLIFWCVIYSWEKIITYIEFIN